MTMTTTNVEILRQGWLDAASALAPGLDTLPELLERGLEDAVVDERLDEQSLLKMVSEVSAGAADSLPAEELYFLTRRLQRAVYEYLLSLDALPEPPPRRDGANGHATHDTSLIGAEEVAALGRNVQVTSAADHPDRAAADLEVTTGTPAAASASDPHLEPELVAQSTAEPAERAVDVDTDAAAAAAAAAELVEAGLAELDAQLSPDEDPDDVPVALSEPEPEALAADPEAGDPVVTGPSEPDVTEPPPSEPSYRPAFTLFRRTGASASKPDKRAAEPDGGAHVEPASNGSGASQHGVATEDTESFVKPKDGFHLSELADFAVVQRSEPAAEAPEDAGAAAETFEAVDPQSAAGAPSAIEPKATAPEAAGDAPSGATTRGWHLRDDDADQAFELDSVSSPGDERFETDPEVVEARLEINDRLRRKRCDEAAALLQQLANDVGGRALAELALDAGDRCRALGKGNAALSCYLAASRADPVHETPLLRLADICIDDHDIDLAVSYLERVTRLRRLRNDDKGALKLYRKIVTIAPYRDDILAMLMRAQANGRFEE